MTGDESQPVVDETVVVAAPADRVWRAIVDEEHRAGWWAYLDLDATVGGVFEEHWTDDDGNTLRTSGRVLDVVEQRLLRLSWADDDWPAPTEVEVCLADVDGGTSVRVRHAGWERLVGGTALADAHRDGWRMHLANLRAYVENLPI